MTDQVEIPDEAPVRVYIAYDGTAYVSKTPNGAELTFSKAAWEEFTAGIARAARRQVLHELAERMRAARNDSGERIVLHALERTYLEQRGASSPAEETA